MLSWSVWYWCYIQESILHVKVALYISNRKIYFNYFARNFTLTTLGSRKEFTISGFDNETQKAIQFIKSLKYSFCNLILPRNLMFWKKFFSNVKRSTLARERGAFWHQSYIKTNVCACVHLFNWGGARLGTSSHEKAKRGGSQKEEIECALTDDSDAERADPRAVKKEDARREDFGSLMLRRHAPLA